ncbi:hypothetical protein FWH58_02755 [Candidatus Saccharibacteria bacterium]|nr:hypothetical protein [Candidatus Saccharibacteria bacterium]
MKSFANTVPPPGLLEPNLPPELQALLENKSIRSCIIDRRRQAIELLHNEYVQEIKDFGRISIQEINAAARAIEGKEVRLVKTIMMLLEGRPTKTDGAQQRIAEANLRAQKLKDFDLLVVQAAIHINRTGAKVPDQPATRGYYAELQPEPQPVYHRASAPELRDIAVGIIKAAAQVTADQLTDF